ncbi:MAG: hypothetical protein C0475_07580 [Planctomyces sp.]|nr:hypothetical protein [Planctomyces sp.]MBA4039603.1 hypothetical protein [Planctomyces sp.]MBA4120499.1 hypothetical protein [Isosphaera sp.]
MPRVTARSNALALTALVLCWPLSAPAAPGPKPSPRVPVEPVPEGFAPPAAVPAPDDLPPPPLSEAPNDAYRAWRDSVIQSAAAVASFQADLDITIRVAQGDHTQPGGFLSLASIKGKTFSRRTGQALAERTDQDLSTTLLIAGSSQRFSVRNSTIRTPEATFTFVNENGREQAAKLAPGDAAGFLPSPRMFEDLERDNFLSAMDDGALDGAPARRLNIRPRRPNAVVQQQIMYFSPASGHVMGIDGYKDKVRTVTMRIKNPTLGAQIPDKTFELELPDTVKLQDLTKPAAAPTPEEPQEQ